MRGCKMLSEHHGEGDGDACERSKRDRRCDGIARKQRDVTGKR